MEKFSVRKYDKSLKEEWNHFLKEAKNGTFLFHRDFMGYHADRFEDYSVIVYKKDKIVALLPANISGKTVYSHQGLTYGNLVLNKRVKLKETAEMLRAVLLFFSESGIETLYLKLMPSIYYRYPADEMVYLLSITNSKTVRTDVSSVIDCKDPLKIASNRMEGVKKGKRNKLAIREETDLRSFWEQILVPNLNTRYDAKPVHSLSEIAELAKKFPKNIRQFNVYKNDLLVGGTTIFETEKVAHVQYISANEKKQQLGTLDFLFEYLIKKQFVEKCYFDFGTSNLNQGRNINEGLLYWKECFGARSIAQVFYEVETSSYKKLDTVFL